MIVPDIALNEAERLDDLLSYDILDTLAEPDFDDITKLAAHICHCEMASISFIDNKRQWFKSRVNITESETSRKDSFCGHAILDNKVMIVLDAKKDERFWDNPHVTGGMSITFYAGAPIYSNAGHALGTICVLDKSKKTTLTNNQISSLKILARQVSRLLQHRIMSKILIVETLSAKEKMIFQIRIPEMSNKSNYSK
jgi:GAF domain-containing protein